MISFLHLLALLVVAYTAVLVVMFVCQRDLVFKPYGSPFTAPHAPFVPWQHETSYGLKTRGFWYPPQPGKPTIVFFQGTSTHLGHRLFKMVHYQQQGFGVGMVGYRGYNGNPGRPTENGLYSDARHAIKALKDKGVREQDMILYGESLGSGVAVQMALEFPHVKAVILEAPYTSVTDVAAWRYPFLPVRFLLRDRFDSLSKIKQLKMPLLIVHGTEDKRVPFIFGNKLYDAAQAPFKRLINIDKGGHHNLFNYPAVVNGIDTFIKELPQ